MPFANRIFPALGALAFAATLPVFAAEAPPTPPPAPDTVNPSLWRQSQLCLKGGLFKVVDRLYQVRNADISNLTIIEGDSGLIVIDRSPLALGSGGEQHLLDDLRKRRRRPVRDLPLPHHNELCLERGGLSRASSTFCSFHERGDAELPPHPFGERHRCGL